MKKYLYIIILSCLSGLAGCRKDQVVQPDMAGGLNQRVQLTLNLPTPQSAAPATYAMTSNDENEIVAVDVLAFKIIAGQELFAYRQQGQLVAAGGSSGQAKFYADLVKGEEDYRFVVLCNSRRELENASATLTIDRPKSEVLAAIVNIQTGKWNALSSANFSPIPMWGESEVINGVDASTGNMSFGMLRSMAAIDITLSDNAVNDFDITSVSLYHSADRGVVAPLAVNYDSDTKSVTQPSLVDGVQNLDVQDYLLTSAAKSFRQEIYLFEHAAASHNNAAEAIGLVIGGRFKGSSATTYYRVDLVNTIGTPIAVLRNHRYTINITSVAAAGSATKEEAWTSKPFKMTVGINDWNESSLAAVNIPEGYDLKVGQTAIQDDGGRKKLGVKLSTSYSGGWTIRSAADWIVPVAASGSSGNNQTVSFNLTGNRSGSARTGTMTISAGKFSKIISVTQAVPNFQDNVPGLDLYIADADLPGTFNWYLAANVQNAYNSKADPMGYQVSPARTGSCAQVYGEGWRLPTFLELDKIIAQKASVGGINSTAFYWSITYHAYGGTGAYAYVNYGNSSGNSSGTIVTGHPKYNTSNRARCVKSIPL